MKGHDDVIDLLNDILTAELTTINVYFLHSPIDRLTFTRFGVYPGKSLTVRSAALVLRTVLPTGNQSNCSIVGKTPRGAGVTCEHMCVACHEYLRERCITSQ